MCENDSHVFVRGEVVRGNCSNSLSAALLYGPGTWWTGVRGHGGHLRRCVSMRFPMPVLEKVSSREELCRLALSAGANKRELCRRFGISPTALYKWVGRYSMSGPGGLEDRSRRPLH